MTAQAMPASAPTMTSRGKWIPQSTRTVPMAAPATISRIVENEETGKVLYICNVNDQIVSMADLGPGAGRGVIPEVGSDVKIIAEPENGYKVYSITVTKTGTNQAFPVGEAFFF